ncbi:MAG: type II secretion system GspH family protein [Hydrogenobacter thermophilus]|uniref:type II secretion system protein n=1 Tax=Hydrogenobacter thermophilus TaxID=940 RepID=UPI001C750701|nr:type II secretion system protein [Hydrogenobacter thermophilus]MCS7284398.1 type II secretion system GspH family protein [Hydrogenobacter thermophilus]QWK19977.1 MAG: type II secretion system GspH family protein [Hydrogenobacter thermophilus]
MRGFTLLELIIVITIMGMLTLVVLPVLQRSLFGERDMLKAFILKNLSIAMKEGKVIELYGDGKKIVSSEGEKIDLPYRGRCRIYPSGELRRCHFGKGGEDVYYTVFDL